MARYFGSHFHSDGNAKVSYPTVAKARKEAQAKGGIVDWYECCDPDALETEGVHWHVGQA